MMRHRFVAVVVAERHTTRSTGFYQLLYSRRLMSRRGNIASGTGVRLSVRLLLAHAGRLFFSSRLVSVSIGRHLFASLPVNF